MAISILDEFSALSNVNSPHSPLLHSIPHETNTSNINGLTLKVHAEAPQGSPTGGGLNRD